MLAGDPLHALNVLLFQLPALVSRHVKAQVVHLMAIKPVLLSGQKLHLEIRAEKRSDPQNRLMWARLTELSRQVNWHGQKLTPEDWKDVLTAALRKQRVVPGVDGGFVVLGQRTSQMSKSEMSELLELIGAFGAQQGVEFAEMEEA